MKAELELGSKHGQKEGKDLVEDVNLQKNMKKVGSDLKFLK